MGEDIKFTCYDEDMMSNDLVGERTIKVKGLCSAFPTRLKIPLYFKNEKSGELNIETKYAPSLQKMDS